MSWNQVFQENPFSLGSWWDQLLGRKPTPAHRELTAEEEEAEEREWTAREEREAGGVWYVYDKGREGDPVVYKVYSETNPIRYVASKLHRKHGDGLRSGPWSSWRSVGEEHITMRVPKTKQKRGKR